MTAKATKKKISILTYYNCADRWLWCCSIGKVLIRHEEIEGYETEVSAKRACRAWFKKHTNYEPEFD